MWFEMQVNVHLCLQYALVKCTTYWIIGTFEVWALLTSKIDKPKMVKRKNVQKIFKLSYLLFICVVLVTWNNFPENGKPIFNPLVYNIIATN